MKGHFHFGAILVLVVVVILVSESRMESQDYSGSSWDATSTSSAGTASSPAPGSLDFETDLFTGKFTYRVPINVAPGRHGVQPALALGYNSGMGNGWCGVGWSLEVGYIQRETRKGVPVPWGATNSLAQYDDSKGFVVNLNGAQARLVCVSGTNQNPMVYRQQVDRSFVTYNYYTNNHWEAVDKNGSTFYFGQGLTNQMENPKPGWVTNAGASTFRWALNKMVTANGDQTVFIYLNDGGMLYLTNISYNANTNSPALAATHTVDFILTNRTDTNISFLSGYRVTTKLKLAEIDSKVAGTNVCKYVLSYVYSPSTTRSLLNQVTEYGSDYATSLPPVTFGYQVQPFQFGAATNWGPVNSQGYESVNPSWSSPGINQPSTDTGFAVEYQANMLVDINGDGLPDRVMKNIPQTGQYWVIQPNNGSGFDPTNIWNSLDTTWAAYDDWSSTSANYWPVDSVNETYVQLLDINGDGLPDRVMRTGIAPYNQFVVQLNNGNSFAAPTNWGSVNGQGYEATLNYWGAPEATYKGGEIERIIDMNGDGLPDRVMTRAATPINFWEVQLNTGSGFGTTNLWNPLQSSYNNDQWNSISANYNPSSIFNDTFVELIDINGDGLPDRVMESPAAPYNHFVVQFNNGCGFEPAENWGPVSGQGGELTTEYWGALDATLQTDKNNYVYESQRCTLIDVNGDGLPDRVIRDTNSPIRFWIVQLNTGSGFGPTNIWASLDSPSAGGDEWNSISSSVAVGGLNESFVQFLDINGDGLPDRVMRRYDAPFTNFIVQFNQGPFPDLVNMVSNGIWGSLNVGYVASTTLDNSDSAHTRGLLPFNEWVVSQTAISDGLGNIGTNIYAYSGGFYYPPERETRGFSQVTVTDPLGVKTTTYFHQSGGRDNSALGEYLDAGTESKKGIPFRTEVVGTDGHTNNISLNKVVEVLLNTNGWYFPFVAQTIQMDFEGLTSYRATAKQASYDTKIPATWL